MNVQNKFEQPGSGGDNVADFDGTVEMDGDTSVEGTKQTSNISFAAAPGAANVCEVTISALDGTNDLTARVQNLKVWLSDAATGAGQSGTTASGTVTAKAASGTVLDTLTAKQSLIVQTLATGVFILEITDTAKTGFYICVENPTNGKIEVSDQLVTGDYGA